MLTGMVFIRQFIQGRWTAMGFSSRPLRTARILPALGRQNPFWRPAPDQPEEGLSTDEFVKSEVDPILDKISRHGIQSLTEHERQILEKARSRMAKRKLVKGTET